MSTVARTARRLLGKVMTGSHAAIYRASDPLLLLTTTGRKTGKERTTPLLYIEDGENLVVIASNGGAPYHPAWYLNLKANPEVSVRVRERDLKARAQEARGEERRRLFARLVDAYSG